MQAHPTSRGPMMARPAGLPCPDCEGMLSRHMGAQPLLHLCGTSLTVLETREDPENPTAPCVWRLRSCPACAVQLATVEWTPDPEPPSLDRPGARARECLDCGRPYVTLEQLVSMDEARDRLAHLARERALIARSGREPWQARQSAPWTTEAALAEPATASADPWEPVRALPPTVAWHLEGR